MPGRSSGEFPRASSAWGSAPSTCARRMSAASRPEAMRGLHFPERMAEILRNPLAFALQVLKAFQANQGLLLAGAVAYYALLSIVPLLILMVIVLSHVIDQEIL